jgi:quinol-cytochrome oxidoreductase complex cytochrome b subunit
MLTLIISLLELNGTTIIGISGNIKMLSFLSYFILKDIFPILIYILIITFIILFIPNKLEDPENNIEFNVLVTPNQIVPL